MTTELSGTAVKRFESSLESALGRTSTKKFGSHIDLVLSEDLIGEDLIIVEIRLIPLRKDETFKVLPFLQGINLISTVH